MQKLKQIPKELKHFPKNSMYQRIFPTWSSKKPWKKSLLYSVLFASVTFAFVRQLPLNTTLCHVDPFAIWDNCLSWPLPPCDVCRPVTFAALRHLPSKTRQLPPCDICRPVTFAILNFCCLSFELRPMPPWDICRFVTFAALWLLPFCDICLFRTFALSGHLPFQNQLIAEHFLPV